MIVFDQNRITAEGAQLIADLAVVARHIGKARSGIIQLKPKANSQGLVDMGVCKRGGRSPGKPRYRCS